MTSPCSTLNHTYNIVKTINMTCLIESFSYLSSTDLFDLEQQPDKPFHSHDLTALIPGMRNMKLGVAFYSKTKVTSVKEKRRRGEAKGIFARCVIAITENDQLYMYTYVHIYMYMYMQTLVCHDYESTSTLED